MWGQTLLALWLAVPAQSWTLDSCFKHRLAVRRKLPDECVLIFNFSRQRGPKWFSHLPTFLPVSGLFGLIWFDAADVVWRAFHQCAHQIVGLFLKDGIRGNIKKMGEMVMKLERQWLNYCLLADWECWRTLHWRANTHIISAKVFSHSDPDKEKTALHSHTFILLPAVVGRPFFSALRFSGNSALMKALLEDKDEELELTKKRLLLFSYQENKQPQA